MRQAIFVSVACALLVRGQDVASVLSGASFSGQQVALEGAYTLQIVQNGSHALYTLNFPDTTESAIGWAGVSTGAEMATMDSYVLWPNSTGGWALSHRTATGNVLPTVPNGDSAYTLAAAGVQIVQSMTNETAVSFIRPMTLSSAGVYATDKTGQEDLPNAVQTFGYAFSPNRPVSDAYDTAFTIHRIAGKVDIDLSAAFAMAAAAPSVTPSATESASHAATPTTASSQTPSASAPPPTVAVLDNMSWTTYDAFVIAHATLGCLAWLILAPIGLLLARYGRELNFWFRYHRGIAYSVAILTIVTFALGAEAVAQNDSSHFTDAHKDIGLLLLILVLIQVALGILAHAYFDPERTHRPVQNIAHIFIGISAMVLVFVQVYLGFQEYETMGGRSTPIAVIIVTSVLIGLVSIAYLGSVAWLIRRRRMGRSWTDAALGVGRTLGGDEALERQQHSEKPAKTGSMVAPPAAAAEAAIQAAAPAVSIVPTIRTAYNVAASESEFDTSGEKSSLPEESPRIEAKDIDSESESDAVTAEEV